jgi:hypothetical protein
MGSGMRVVRRSRRRVSGLGFWDALLAPIATVVGGGLNVWGTIEATKLAETNAAAQAQAYQSQMALQQTAAVTQAVGQAQTRKTIETVAVAALALGGVALGGYLIYKATKGGPK